MKRYEYVIFDLDGTLMDTSTGIMNSVRHTEKAMDLKPIPDWQLFAFFGPPPRKVYQQIHQLSYDHSLKAARHHRDYAASRGIYEAYVYEHMEELLKILKDEGRKLAVATLKREDIAKMILSHFDLLDYFDCVVGQNFDETLTKANTIEQAMTMMGCREDRKVIMIGDSEGDLEGAEAVGIDFLGVTYGFGLKPENQMKSSSLSATSIQEVMRFFEIN